VGLTAMLRRSLVFPFEFLCGNDELILAINFTAS
jgi:hypothetical protein